jgi:hypothetical protein
MNKINIPTIESAAGSCYTVNNEGCCSSAESLAHVTNADIDF